MVNIEGLSKARVLAALYNAASPKGMGFLQYDPKPMTEEEAAQILLKTSYFDYLKGRVMKISLESDKEFNEGLYDRDNGLGVADVVVDSIRHLEDVNNSMISSLHKRGKFSLAEKAKKLVDTKSSFEQEPGSSELKVTLGADELGPVLKEAVKKATGE